MNARDYERARSALAFIPPDDRDRWVSMGMALKDGFGDEGFDLWDAWSRQSDRYNERDARDVWRSLKAGGGITLGSLFHEAKARGWRDDGTYQKPTPEEIEARRREAAERTAKEEAEKAREHAEAASNAAAIWKAATPTSANHPYLARKQVAPVESLREIEAGTAAAVLGYAPKRRGEPLTGRLLVVPVKMAGELSTVEFIDEAGRKSALYGSAKAGGYWAAQTLPNGDGAELTLLIGEGVATVLSTRHATGCLVIATLSCGNLLAVAREMRKRFPAAGLVMLADLGNGQKYAEAAASAVGGQVAVPDFGENRPKGATDFNDLAMYCGPEAVRRAIAGAEAPAGDEARPGNGAAKGGGPGNATPAGGAAPAFLTATKLWNMKHDPTRWAVPGILPEGVTILGGKPKIGKSWLALDVAIAVGTGWLALGTIDVEAGPVLYLALEDTKRRLTKRLRILCGDTKPPPEQIEFLTDCPRLGSGGEEVLRAWLRDHPTARLVVIDTLARFRPPTNAKETLYANDYVIGEYLSRLCVEFQVSILLLGHLRKQPGDEPIDEISGTLGLVGSVDGYMVLRRRDMSDEATLYVCGRDVDEPAEHCIAWDRDRARWSITGGDPRVSRLSAEQRRVYELLSEAPKNIKELTEALNPGHVVTDLSSDQKYKNAASLVYKLRDREVVSQRPFDRRWAPSTEKRGRIGGRERTGGTEGTGGRQDGKCSASTGCSTVLPVPSRNPGTPDRGTEPPGEPAAGKAEERETGRL